VAFQKGQSGNPAGMKKGTKHNKTRARERRALASASLASAIAASTVTVGRRVSGAKVLKIDVEKPGINSKALLNTAMRIAWQEYNDLTQRAAILTDKLDAARLKVAGLEPDPEIKDEGERAKELQARQAVGQDACQKIADEIRELRANAAIALNAATGWAKDVSPYEFPRLMTQNGQIDANLTITIKKYSPKPQAKVEA
jgi:hypothetical protein